MDIGKSFTFVFDDEDWLKQLVIGGLIAFIPIVNFAAFGYVVQVIRNARDGQDVPLPEWSNNFGQYFMDGLKVFVGLLVYYAPLIVVAVGLAIVVGVLGAATGEDLGGAEDIFAVVMICFQCIMITLGVAPYLLFPALFAQYADEGEISAMLRLGEVWGFIQQDLGSYLIVLLLSFAVISFVAPLGILACLVGIILTQWWSYLVFGHLTGQLMRQNAAGV